MQLRMTFSALLTRCMQRLSEHKVEFIVAPYEADAQLAYLSKIGSTRTRSLTLTDVALNDAVLLRRLRSSGYF